MSSDNPSSELDVKLENIWASYNSFEPILQNCSLKINKGSSYVLMGPSGIGKTTLLKVLNGLISPSKGNLEVFSQLINNPEDLVSLRNRIGYIPQNLGLINNLGVLENVLLGALSSTNLLRSLSGKFRDEDLIEAKKSLKLVGLEDKVNRRCYALSGGEKQRVAIARALVQKPKLLLADELVAELDYVTSREIMSLLHDVRKRLGLTTIMVHHDIDIAKNFGDKIGLLKHGMIHAEMNSNEIDVDIIKNMISSDNV